MSGWRWRVILAVIGLVLVVCSTCLITSSRLQIERRRDRDVVPIEAPPTGWAPDSDQGMACIPPFLGAM